MTRTTGGELGAERTNRCRRDVPMLILAGLVALLPGCSWLNGGPSEQRREPGTVRIRFHLAANEPREGYDARTDEVGRPLHIAPQPFLTDQQIWSAANFEGSGRNLVRLDFDAAGAAILERTTRTNRGARLAVYIRDELVMSPLVDEPITVGQVYLDAGFSRQQAQEIVRGIEAQRLARSPGQNAPESREPPAGGRP